MISVGCVLAIALLVTLIAGCSAFDTAHGGNGVLGVVTGLVGFVALVSARFLLTRPNRTDRNYFAA
jgi:hypothetical protein